MKILKKNIGLVSIYLLIFFSIAMVLQASAKKEHLEDFEKTRIDLAIADQDDSTLSHALTKYLKTIHNVYKISAEPTVMQEELFYRNAEYIVQIPKNFYETCIVDENPLSVTKVPGSYSSFYVDQQINAWLNSIRTYTAAGFSQKEAMKQQLRHLDIRIISAIFRICFWPYCATPWAISFWHSEKRISRNVCRHLPSLPTGRILKGFLQCLPLDSPSG